MATAIRMHQHAYIDIVTIRRIDEILAGCVLALVYQKYGKMNLRSINHYHYIILTTLLAISSHPEAGFINYFRPYIAATLIGITAFQSQTKNFKYLESATLSYLAKISFALYIIHGILGHTWLGSGEKLVKYLKRPLLFLATFLLAHFSTYYYEAWFIALGKKITKKKATAQNDTLSS
jgi:peptidoglycan/LPS O-acetylase OafA/YrhL